MKACTVIILLALGLLAGGAMRARAQSFSFVPNQTILAETLGMEMVFEATCTNLSQIPLTLTFIRTINALPVPWESSMCLDVCYPSTVDTIATTPEYGSSPLAPGEVRTFSLHVYPITNPGTGLIRILVMDRRNIGDSAAVLFTATATTSAVGEDPESPAVFLLHQNYPNPFNGETTIGYRVANGGRGERVTLRVYDLSGRLVATLVDAVQGPGEHVVKCEAGGLATGAYIYQLQAGTTVTGRKFLVIR